MSGGGKLIVFEGPEGVGKSTQVERLAAFLSAAGMVHVTMREPGATRLGEQVRSLLLDPANDVHPRAEALLFMAARAQLAQTVIDRLAAGHTVVMDRFFLSTYAYQVGGRGLPENEVRAANDFARTGLVPDLTILLLYPVGAGLARVDERGPRDRMEQAGARFHEQVAQAFMEFADSGWQSAHPEAGRIRTVDATGAEDAVFARVLDALAEHWPETFRRSLWSKL